MALDPGASGRKLVLEHVAGDHPDAFVCRATTADWK
jgi:hypothetical protein